MCERTFLPPKSELEALRTSGLVTLESQTPVDEFDIFALSVSFEWDYTNVLTHCCAWREFHCAPPTARLTTRS